MAIVTKTTLKLPKGKSFASNSRKEVANALEQAVIGYMVKKNFACTTQVGLMLWGKYRADVVALNKKSMITIVEIKSCLVDFKADKKFQNYYHYCNKFYFACLDRDYEKIKDKLASVNKDIGIMVLNTNLEDVSMCGKIQVMKNAKQKQLPVETTISILARLAWKNSAYSKRTNTRRVRIYVV